MRSTRRRDSISHWFSSANRVARKVTGSQVFRSFLTAVLIAGLTASSFYWGMWVERGRTKPAPQVTIGPREPVVTERSEDTPKTGTSTKTTVPKAASTSGTASKPEAKPAASTAPAAKPATPSTPGTPSTPAPVPLDKVGAKSTAASAAMPVTGEAITKYDWVYSAAFGDWRFHTGVDIQAELGTPVKAALPGKILSIEDDPIYGCTVVIDHGSGVTGTYAGVTDVSVAVGEGVAKNQVIARIGEPGVLEADMGPHLHFEIKEHAVPQNPEQYLSIR